MIISGYLFGFLMQKGQVFAPQIVAAQFTFESFIMLKMFLAAAASSMIVQICNSFLNPEYFITTRKAAKVDTWRTILGGSILGAGMFVAGSCPGMI